MTPELMRERLVDHAPRTEGLLDAVLQGLSRRPKSLPCKWLYDARGSALFERICELDEYYPTRTEVAILERHGAAMAKALGRDCGIVEYGSGSAVKTPLLLDRLEQPAGYVPVDISMDALLASAVRLSARYPELDIRPVCADYTGQFDLPRLPREPARWAAWFPGSTIGNFRPDEARAFLATMAEGVHGGPLLIGVDLRKDAALLEAAYDDAEGVTAAFNLNLLERINRELDADFDLDRFRHEAFFSDLHGRIEMHLVSREDQAVTVAGRRFEFEMGESIHTESSYKYSLAGFASLASLAGLRVEQVWTDPRMLFSVQLLRGRR